MRQGAIPTSVPLSGFLSLSAVSWQAQTSWPCFVPQPFLGFLLQSLPLTEIACPSRDPLCFLVVIDQRAVTPPSGPYHRRFPRLPRFHAVAWFPRRLWAPFSRSRKNVTWLLWVRMTELVSFR